MRTEDPRQIVAAAPMGRAQIVAIALAILLNAVDGFDVLSISFAAPGIAKEWGIDRAALGVVLSMELIGMAVGSVLLGQLCDRIGRRPTVLLCLMLMVPGMALAATAADVMQLSLWRLCTGFGIGGMLAATNAVAAEFANDRRRALVVSLMAAGYPVGAVLGGLVASAFLVDQGWRSVFLFGAGVSAVFVPLVWLFLPESVGWLAQKRPPDAVPRINAVLARLRHPPIDALPAPTAATPRASLGALFAPGLGKVTLLLTLTYFAHIITFYFILKWVPKIVTDMGFPPSAAGVVLVWANVGGLAGSVILSLLTQVVDVRRLTLGAMLLSTAMIIWFGRTGADLGDLSLAAAMAGFCTNAGVVGLYALIAQSFPTALRGGGTGFVIGVGRGGAALSPVVAGLLFAAGAGLPTVAIVMALGSVVAVAAILLLGPASRADG